MGDKRAGSIVAAVTLTIVVAFAVVALMFVRSGRISAVSYAEDTTELLSTSLFYDLSEAPDAMRTLEVTLTTFAEDHKVDAAAFSQDFTVIASSEDFLAEGSSAEASLPSEVAEILGTLMPDDKEHEHVWVGLDGLLPRGQALFGIRWCPAVDAYLIIRNEAQDTFETMRERAAALALTLAVVMVLLLLLLMFIVRWYRKRLIRAATTDELTGLRNRKAFASSFERRQRDGELTSATLALVDVDFFKHVNDTYGHAAGDEALAAVAGCLADLAGTRGLAGRWGGDEFIVEVALPERDAKPRIEDTIARVASLTLRSGAKISISVGAAEIDETLPLERMVERCDDALYVTKEGGRGFLTCHRLGVTPHMAYQQTSAAQVAPSAPEAKARKEEPALNLSAERRAARRIVDIAVESLLAAVGHMVPFVVAGGIFIALAFLIDGLSVDLSSLSPEARASFGSITPEAAGLKEAGSAAFNFMLPIVAAFFARGVGGEEAFMAGFAGGYLASQGSSGYLGAILAAIVSATVANLMRGFVAETPAGFRRTAPVLLYPLFSLAIMYLLMNFVLAPFASAFDALLTNMIVALERGGSRPLLGSVLGAMMATDMGGPINKSAYHFGVAAIASGSPDIMASVMVGGMVPPVGIALSMLLFPNRYTRAERDIAPSTLVLGLAFVTEGAIPFAITDILRVIPASMVGSAVAGALSAAFGCTLMAPHGGIFVFPVVGEAPLYLVALLLGSLATALVLGALKRPRDFSA